MANYKSLIVFQKADELAHGIYNLTKKFPKDEIYGISSQLRRAALSIPTNIVEGYAISSDKELKQFLKIAMGSHAETEYLFQFSKRLGFHKKDESDVELLISEVGKLLWSFNKSI